MSDLEKSKSNKNTRVLRNSVVIVILMFGFGFALIPLGQKCLQWLGYSGEARQAYLADLSKIKVDKKRKITVEFFSDVNPKLKWQFAPGIRKVEIHPGQKTHVFYVAKNLTGHQSRGLARFNIDPPDAGRYFFKTECFCFTQQSLAKGETRKMPLVFIVSPNLPKRITSIGLTYEFLKSEEPKPKAKQIGTTKEALMKAGAKIYANNCSVCHQPTGKGEPPAYPPLKGSQIVNGPAINHINLVLRGKNRMPKFGPVLSDDKIAAVLTYERHSWGNTGSVVEPTDVKNARKKIAKETYN